jgi:hypothetical protein
MRYRAGKNKKKPSASLIRYCKARIDAIDDLLIGMTVKT